MTAVRWFNSEHTLFLGGMKVAKNETDQVMKDLGITGNEDDISHGSYNDWLSADDISPDELRSNISSLPRRPFVTD